jgi:hypothetical protein
MHLAHVQDRPARLTPLAIAVVLLALGLAIAAFVLTLTNDDGGTTVVREVSVTRAAAAPAHFKGRPDESATAATVGQAFRPSASEQQAAQRSPFPGLSAQAKQAGQQYGTSQYRVNPSTGFAVPQTGSRADGGPDESAVAEAVSP